MELLQEQEGIAQQRMNQQVTESRTCFGILPLRNKEAELYQAKKKYTKRGKQLCCINVD